MQQADLLQSIHAHVLPTLKDSMTEDEPPAPASDCPGARVMSAVKEMFTPRSYLVPIGHVKLVKDTSTPF